ncbi:hypothetical protein HOG21_04510 [bacterium]|jgi:hypothetical protein|nr:hypothetical protein [bacterium]
MTDITKIIKKEQTEVTDRLMELRKIQNEEILKTATKFEKNNTEISD